MRVLLYHRVGDDRYPSTNVSIEAFRAQMAWLRENDYAVVPTASLEDHLLRGESVPPKSVVLHFDDGYRSLYEYAYPVLREHEYPFTVFLPTDALEKGYSDYLTWEMVAEMAANGGLALGSHGHEHLRLATCVSGMRPEACREQVRAELRESIQRLRARGYAARWVAYPYGEYSQTVLDEARRAGFTLGFSQDPGAVWAGGDLLRLPRFAVVGDLAGLATFAERAGYGPLAVADLLPPPGLLKSATPGRYGAVVLHPDRYVPGSASLFVSEFGRAEAGFDPSTARVEASSPATLTRRRNRVLISLRDKESGTYCLASWMILNPTGE